MLKKLGVIGGMGPEATSFYYARVIARTKAESDQEHINMIILSHATMPDRTQAILTGNKLPFLKAITQDARDLEMLGVENIAIPCNTSHYFLEDIQKSTSVPIINMVEESVRYVVEAHPKVKKIGIMGTDGTMQLRSISAELIIGLAAQQFVNRHIQSLTLDIPAGDIDRSHGRGDDDTAAHAPERMTVQVLPDLLGVERIHTDDQLAKILALAKCSFCRFAVSQTCFTPAINAGIGVDLHGDETANGTSAEITFDARDFHTWNLHFKLLFLYSIGVGLRKDSRESSSPPLSAPC